jgi:hypothetical protein
MIRAEESLEPTAERIRLMRHGLINMIGPVISGVVGIILVPLMFKSLSAELYGLWVIVITLVDRCGAFGDLGVSWSVMREIAGSSSESAEPLVKAAANLYLLLAIAGAVIIYGSRPPDRPVYGRHPSDWTNSSLRVHIRGRRIRSRSDVQFSNRGPAGVAQV